MRFSRRAFLMGAGAAAIATHPVTGFAQEAKSPFKIAVINDEISPDFDHACHVVAQEFGLHLDRASVHVGKEPDRAGRS